MKQPIFNPQTAQLLRRLSELELDKLDHFVKCNGRSWRIKLRKHWANDEVILSETREKIGPDRLDDLKFPAECYRK